MIYGILSIPFGAAAIYYICANSIKNNCFIEITKEVKEELEELGVSVEEGSKMFDTEKARWRLLAMAICWYLGYPIIQFHKKITE